jgi:polyisoprenoid-binding protein YceI
MKVFLFLILSVGLLSTTQAKQVPLNTKTSEVQWLGKKKFTGDSHNGLVKVKKGSVNLDDNMGLVGGTIVIDMTSIDDKDLSGNYKTKLENHLKSDDFFDVKNNPEATFKITQVETTRSNAIKVTGSLTIRGNTHPETFELVTEKKGKVLTATGQIFIDRTKYGVSYNQESSLLKKAVSMTKDSIIDDKIQLDLKLETQAI